MRFIRKALGRKFVLLLLLLGALDVAVVFYYPEYFKYAVVLSFLGFAGFYYWEILRPLSLVMREVQALLSGKSYRKVYTERVDEFGVLGYFFNKVTESFSEVSYDIKDRRRMIDELSVAAQLQKDILPANASLDIQGLEVVAKNRPATELGGDSFNFFTVKGKTYIYIGDVTGHGVAAGLIMTMVNSLISVFADLYESPYDILVNVNRYIKRHVKKAMFMTLVMLCWDNEKKTLSFVGAGHEHILVYRAASGVCDAILSGGVALGMVPDNSKVISEKPLALEEGDMVILYSDGITEAKNKAGELFGLDRLKQLVVEYAPDYSPEGVHYKIAKTVSEYMEGHGQDDDITLIVMKKDSSFDSNAKKATENE